MTKELVLNKKDITLIHDILDYFMADDGVEKQDFKDVFGDGFFDKYGNLKLELCGLEHRTHIFYKMSVISQQLTEGIM